MDDFLIIQSYVAQSHLTLLHSQRYWPINPAMSLSVVTPGSLVTPAAQWTGDRTCHYSSRTQQNTCVQYRCPSVTSHHITPHHTTPPTHHIQVTQSHSQRLALAKHLPITSWYSRSCSTKPIVCKHIHTTGLLCTTRVGTRIIYCGESFIHVRTYIQYQCL